MLQRVIRKIAWATVAMLVMIHCAGERERSGERRPARADDWDAFVQRLPRGTDPNAVIDTFSLAFDLAMIHNVILNAPPSPQASRIVDVYGRAARDDAHKLHIDLPPASLTDSFDPHVSEEFQRIALADGRVAALCFQFSYHAYQADFTAAQLRRKRSDDLPVDGLLELALQFHTDQAVTAAKTQRFPAKTIREGETLAAELRDVLPKVPAKDRFSSYESFANRFSNWHSAAKAALELRMQLILTRR